MQWTRFIFLIAIIVAIIGAAVVLGARQVAPVVIAASMLGTTLRVATPLTLGALSGVYCERAGVVNIAIEGMMLSAAFFGFLAAIYTNGYITDHQPGLEGVRVALSLGTGVVIAILSGGLMGVLHAILSVTYKVDQIISGTVINVLAVGITGFLNRALFFQGNVPHAPGVLPTIRVPVLSDLPVVGPIFEQQPIAIAAVALVLVTHFVLFYTRWGLRTRAVGEHPRAADTVGINVYLVRYMNVIAGGALAGLGGAYFSLQQIGQFVPNITGGRGFIALAAMIFGKWHPVGALLACLLFAGADALAARLNIAGINIPGQFLSMLPYLVTIVVVAGAMGRAVPPAADGKPYRKA
jgi:simple sugar transport system permease protein